MLVTLTEIELAAARTLGHALAEKFRDADGAYGANTPAAHEVGKRGEFAVEAWVRGFPSFFVSYFRDIELYLKKPDLRVATAARQVTGLEVKTWREHNWDRLARCVSVAQIDKVVATNDYVIWCTVGERESWGGTEMTNQVTIRGWSTCDEVAAALVVNTGTEEQPAMNHQVAVANIHPIAELRTMLGF